MREYMDRQVTSPTWGLSPPPPTPRKQALWPRQQVSVFVWKRRYFSFVFKKICFHTLHFWMVFACPHKNAMVTENGLKMVPSLKGACAFTGTQHSDVIIFKTPPIYPATRVQQNGICKHFHSGECFWNDALLLFGDRFQQIRVEVS